MHISLKTPLFVLVLRKLGYKTFCMYNTNHKLYQDYCYAVILDYSCFGLKRVMCHQQKALPMMRFRQTNHLCRLEKTVVLEMSPVALQIFPIQILAHSKQLSETYLIERSQ